MVWRVLVHWVASGAFTLGKKPSDSYEKCIFFVSDSICNTSDKKSMGINFRQKIH